LGEKIAPSNFVEVQLSHGRHIRWPVPVTVQ
jgi:hypothetical protein